MTEREPSLIQVEEAEMILWTHEGEDRLATFDRQTAIPHEDAWKEQPEKTG